MQQHAAMFNLNEFFVIISFFFFWEFDKIAKLYEDEINWKINYYWFDQLQFISIFVAGAR